MEIVGSLKVDTGIKIGKSYYPIKVDVDYHYREIGEENIFDITVRRFEFLGDEELPPSVIEVLSIFQPEYMRSLYEKAFYKFMREDYHRLKYGRE